MNPKGSITFTNQESSSQRLDKVIISYLSSTAAYRAVTRARVSNWIRQGRVRVNGQVVAKAGSEVKPGGIIELEPVFEERLFASAYDFKLDIVYQDSHLMVLNKPAGISMHPGAGDKTKTLLNALVHYFQKEAPVESAGPRPWIVHRLDRDTTGLIVVAKDQATHNALSSQIRARSMTRLYRALVFCTPRARREVNLQDSGIIEATLGRHPKKRTQMAVVSGGREAHTSWTVLERMPYGCVLDVRLKTGRTHQIRVHMNHIGSPVIGDPVYGDFSGLPVKLSLAAKRFGRQALHARAIKFTHPHTCQPMEFEAGVPGDFEELLQ